METNPIWESFQIGKQLKYRGPTFKLTPGEYFLPVWRAKLQTRCLFYWNRENQEASVRSKSFKAQIILSCEKALINNRNWKTVRIFFLFSKQLQFRGPPGLNFVPRGFTPVRDTQAVWPTTQITALKVETINNFNSLGSFVPENDTGIAPTNE